MHQGGFVYIMASRRNGTLYLGVTSDLIRRVSQHRAGLNKGFTRRYDIKLLVWFTHFEDIRVAIHRETQMKGWKREWKVRAIQETNLEWRDLALEMGFDAIGSQTRIGAAPATP